MINLTSKIHCGAPLILLLLTESIGGIMIMFTILGVANHVWGKECEKGLALPRLKNRGQFSLIIYFYYWMEWLLQDKDSRTTIIVHSLMETITVDAMPFPHETANYDEVSMQQSMLFSDSLKDLKNLRKQLYSAAEYFELSYNSDQERQIVVNTLKDYAIKALVNTVDHLGSVTYKVNNLLDEKVDEVSGTELRVSCIQQRLRTCREYIDREGLSQQSLMINTPKYHKRYVLPVRETMHGSIRTKSKYHGCILEDGAKWHQFRSAIRAAIHENPPLSAISQGWSQLNSPKLARQPGNFSFFGNMSQLNKEKRAPSPHRFPILRTGSLSSKPSTPKSSQPTTPIRSRPTTPNPSLGRQPFISEPRKSASMRLHVGKESPKEIDQIPSKSKRLLKALLSRRKSKKDDMLYTYLDEY